MLTSVVNMLQSLYGVVVPDRQIGGLVFSGITCRVFGLTRLAFFFLIVCFAAREMTMEMDKVHVTTPAGQNVWINRFIISGSGGSNMLMLVAYELFKKCKPPQRSWSSLQAKLKKLDGCGQASAEQLNLLKRAGVVSNGAPSVTLITVEATKTMFRGAPDFQAAVTAICRLPDQAPATRWVINASCCGKFLTHYYYAVYFLSLHKIYFHFRTEAQTAGVSIKVEVPLAAPIVSQCVTVPSVVRPQAAQYAPALEPARPTLQAGRACFHRPVPATR